MSSIRQRALAVLPLLLASCGAGRIYTHTTVPLDVNFNATPMQPREAEGDVKELRYRLVDVQWDSNAIGEIALANGIDEVFYADLETLSVLGIWTKRIVHVYGRRATDPEPEPAR